MLKVVLEAYKFRNEVRKFSVENLEHWVRRNTKFCVEYFTENSDNIPIKVTPYEEGFVYSNALVNAIYVRAGMNNYKTIETLVHEIGHTVIWEKYPDLTKEEEERSVKNFTRWAMYPERLSYLLYVFFARKIIFFVIFAVVLLQSSYCIFKYKTELNGNNRVYITKNGSCYHTENCGMIKDSEKAAIKMSEAKKGFDKCKVCNPE